MEKFNRAVRRHHVDRLKHKRKHYWGYSRNGFDATNTPVEMDARQLGKVVQYPQICSCGGCGNVRRHLWMNDSTGYTLQEQRWLTQYKEQLNEI